MERSSCSIGKTKIISDSKIFHFFSLCFYYFVLFLLKIVFPLLFSLKVIGKHHMKGIPVAVTVSNHCLYLDPAFIAFCTGRKRLYFSGMEETFVQSKKLFDLMIRLLGGFPIPRNSPLFILEPLRNLITSRKPYIHFFPEGVMTYKNQRTLKPFKPGAFYISEKLDIPIIPMAIIIKPRVFWFSRLIIEILPPQYPQHDYPHSRFTQKEALLGQAQEVRSLIQNCISSYHLDETS